MNRRTSRNRTYRSPAATLRDSATGVAIAHLPNFLRWVMILSERNGLSTREIAGLVGTGTEVVESTRNRGLALIQKELLMRVGRGPAKERRP